MKADNAMLRDLWLTGDWRQLLSPLWTRSRSVAFPMVRYLPDAGDLADDVAGTVVARCVALSYVPNKPLSFVATMARRIALDMLKSGAVRFADDSPDAYDGAVSPALDPLDQIIAREDALDVRRTLGLLRPDMAAVLSACMRESARGFARRTGANLNTMNVRMFRAKRAFRAAWLTSPTQHQRAHG